MRIFHLSAAFAAATAFTVALPARADTYTAAATADAFVAAGTSGNNFSAENFGGAGSLTVEAGNLPHGQYQSVIGFDLSGAESYFNNEYGAGNWIVQSVTLVLSASAHSNPMFNTVAPGQFGVSLMQNNSWVEGTGTGGSPSMNGITYQSLLGTYINNSTDQGLGTFNFVGGTSGTGDYQLGLSSGLVGDLGFGSDLSLRLYPNDSSVSYLFDSRQAGSTGPQLEIVATPEPGTFALGLAGPAVWWLRRKFAKPRKAA